MAVQGRVGRLTALAIATGTLVASGVGSAAAAGPAGTSQLTATGNGSALHLTINLPAAAAAVLGTSRIDQTISLTDGKISTVGLPSADTSALLGSGDTPVLSALLAKSTHAALTGKSSDSSSGFTINQPGFQVSVLPLSSKVADPTTTVNGVVATSSSAIAHIAIGGLPLTALNTITAPVQATLSGALGTTSGGSSQATSTVAGVVNSAINQLNTATSNGTAPATAPVQAAVNTAVSDLNSTLTGLTSTLTNLGTATNLVSLDAVTSDQTISRNGAALTSTVANTVKNLNVLNGLVKVSAITSQATATAGGTPGTATAATNAPVFKVDIANGALTALLDQNGLNIAGTAGSALPSSLQSTVNGALNSVNGLLNSVAGVNVALGQGKTSAAPDGTSAAAAVAATVLTVDPPVLHTAGLLAAGTPLLTLQLVSANAAVGSQLLPPVAEPFVPPTSLPRTGGELPLTGAIATLLLGTAMVVRRRRSTQVG